MKTYLLLFAIGLGWAATTIPAILVAQDVIPEDTTTENFELSLLPGVQLRGEDSAIQILRLGLYNRNVSVQGLDIGIVNQTTGGISTGLQFGVVGFVEGDFSGWQQNFVNIVGGEFNGLQGPLVLYNEMTSGEAVQVGFFNRASDIRGFQFGISTGPITCTGFRSDLSTSSVGRRASSSCRS